jgi:hypothetical protein
MTDKILEISDKLRADEITTIEARNLLLGLFIVSVNEVPFNMQDLMLYYDKSKFVFNSPISDIVIGMLNER